MIQKWINICGLHGLGGSGNCGECSQAHLVGHLISPEHYIPIHFLTLNPPHFLNMEYKEFQQSYKLHLGNNL